ncbi:hypothetical protein [Pseudophaeobacter sp.]|uniref:hypothetical protein n=1 Tax=Pseudophaeobacter sp. TaxID=1971739 RepID=UPI0032982C9D
MRTQGWFERLALADHTPATFKPILEGTSDRVCVAPKDAESFHKRFVTSATMESQFSQNRKILLKKLRAA